MKLIWILPIVTAITVVNGAEQTTAAKKPGISKVRPKTDPSPLVTEWLKRYASPSAFQARIKNVYDRLRPDQAQIQAVLSGKTKLKLNPPLRDGSKTFESADLLEMTSSRKLEVIDWATQQMLGAPAEDAFEAAERNKKMLQVMEDLVRSRPADQLLILDAGGLHGLDLFFSTFLKNPEDKLTKRRNEIFYFFSPVTGDTALRTKKYEEVFELIRGVEASRRFMKDVEVPNYLFLLARLHFFQQLSSGGYTLEKLLQEAPGKVGVLVFMDHHGLDVREAFERLPSASAWKQLGYKSVVIATEEFKAGKTYGSDDYARVYVLTEESPALVKAEEKIKKWVKQNRVVSHPAQEALHQRLIEYNRQGLPVTYTGLESRERMERIGKTDEEKAE